ncbi:MAG: peptide ABC transporter substrate-binding protein [Fusobacteriaceae bacterium]
MKKIMYLVLVISLIISGCGENKDEKVVKKGTVSEKKVPQEFNSFLGAEPKTLDGSKATDLYSTIILALNNEGLVNSEVQLDGSEKIVPAGAKEWTISEDGLIYTFKLREESIWADGKKITANDYIYGILRTLNPETGSLYAYLISSIKGADAYNSGKGTEKEVGLRALDEYTLEITLTKPTAYFLELGYFKILFPQRKDIIEKSGDRYGSEAETLIANGPFILKEWIHNNKVIFEKNPTYWDKDNIKLDKMTFSIIRDENARMNLLLNGQVDLGGVSKPEWMEKFEKMGTFNFISKSSMGTNYTTYNTTSKYFKNTKIRKAFSLAINREELNQVIFNGRFEPAYAWVPKGIQINGKEYRTLAPEFLKVDKDMGVDPVELLKEGLRELGFPEEPSKVTINYLSSGTDDWSRKYAEYLQQMYKKNLGIEIKAEFTEWAVYQKRTGELDYEMGGQALSAGYNDPNSFLNVWTSTAGLINNGWKNPVYDELIEKASNTNDQEKRIEYFKMAEKLLVADEAVIAPTLYRMSSTFIRKYVKGYNPPAVAPYNYKGVYMEEKIN